MFKKNNFCGHQWCKETRSSLENPRIREKLPVPVYTNCCQFFTFFDFMNPLNFSQNLQNDWCLPSIYYCIHGFFRPYVFFAPFYTYKGFRLEFAKIQLCDKHTFLFKICFEFAESKIGPIRKRVTEAIMLQERIGPCIIMFIHTNFPYTDYDSFHFLQKPIVKS